ncbi:DMT family transporter [Alkalimarinus alittae]|uniref:DMT family transporter n=1 Tax=Alkalimarinus alittae TaxID=2961619 RepID=A0ABY6N7P8_9ALTE|nr:DMT family transporter [Alkalimarinus alittae]
MGFWGMFYAGSLLSPGLATVITNTQPLIASLLGWYFLSERPSKNSMIGIGLGFIGIFIISSGSITLNNPNMVQGILFVLIAAIGIAVSNILLKRIANKVDIYNAMGLQLCIGAIPLGALNLYQGNILSLQLTLDYILILSVLTLFGTALPFVLWFWLLRRAPLFKLNVFSFLTPVFGLLIGYIYFFELLSPIQWLGIFITGIAIFMVGRSNEAIEISS